MLKFYYFLTIFIYVQSRPYAENVNERNIQVISRNVKKHKDARIMLDKNNESSNPRTIDGLIDLYTGGIIGGLDLLEDALYAGKNSETTTTISTTTTTLKLPESTTPTITTAGFASTQLLTSTTPVPITTPSSKNGNGYDTLQYVNNLTDTLIYEFNNSLAKHREIRQEDPKENEVDINNNVEATTFTFDSSERQERQEEPANPVIGLISNFLGQLSKADGSVDVEAIVGLLSGLSTQNEDGTYDFQGLSDLLMGFFGGEGGSDVGAFVGGLLGATIKGVANPPGAKGAGIFTGNVLNGILPALSGPAPPPEGDENKTPKPALDSGGFLTGLISTILGGSAGASGGNGGGGGGGHFGQFKNSLLKLVFKIISTIFSVSSSSSSNKG